MIRNHDNLRDESEFDRLLDQATASYTPAEPRFGLKTRVLNSLAESRNSETPRVNPGAFGLWWFAAASIAFALAVFIGVWIYAHPSAPSPQSAKIAFPIQVSPSRPLAEAIRTGSRSTSLPKIREPIPNRIVHEAKTPKPTEQELLLEQLVANGASKSLAIPPSDRDTLAALTVQPIENNPIKIQPISTEPICIGPIQIAALKPLTKLAQ